MDYIQVNADGTEVAVNTMVHGNGFIRINDVDELIVNLSILSNAHRYAISLNNLMVDMHGCVYNINGINATCVHGNMLREVGITYSVHTIKDLKEWGSPAPTAVKSGSGTSPWAFDARNKEE